MPLLIRLLVALALLAPASSPQAQEPARPLHHLFYEAMSADAPPGLPYETRQRLTERARDELIPAVLRAAGLDALPAATTLRMGGYRLETNPTLHTAVPLDDAPSDRLAGALGWVLRQQSVLVADFGEGGATGYALVRFPAGTLTPERAQSFFAAAAAVHEGLGGGYTAFGDDLLFLNLRGADGTPDSGLGDDAFAAALRRAADGFPEARLAETGKADARLVRSGHAVDPALSAALSPLRDRHADYFKDLLMPVPAR